MQKHLYQVKLNQGRILRSPIRASFGGSKDIQLHINHDGILIMLFSSAKKNGQDILSGEDVLFADATRKALTIYAIRYGCFLNVTSMEILVDGLEQENYKRRSTDTPLIYSLSEGRLRMPFGVKWRKSGIEASIACTSKSNYDGRHTALYALLAAKSDRYEIERFTYYWMAMNGLYGYIARLGSQILTGYKGVFDREYKEHGFFVRCYGYEPVRLNGRDESERETHAKRLQWQLSPIIRSIPEEKVDSFCLACISSNNSNTYTKRLLDAIDNLNIKYDYKDKMPLFQLMVIWFPYRLRCRSVHGENALPTFCYKDDAELKVLRAINRLLDCFLTQELAFWLDKDDAVETKRQKMLKQAAENHAYDKWRV